MGRSESGVRAISESSIEIAFSYRGVRCRERVRLKPTPANLKRAARHRAAVLDAIERNTFDYAKTFPDSARRLLFLDRPGEALALSAYLRRALQVGFHPRQPAIVWVEIRTQGDGETPGRYRPVFQ